MLISSQTKRLTILVSGMMAATPRQGGATWAVLQYLLGLRDLGHDVFFVEPLDGDAVSPPGVPLASSDNASYCRQVMADFGLQDRWALLMSNTKETAGLTFDQLEQIVRRSDLLLNISGLLSEEELLSPIPVRVYLDLDPAFTQLWNEVEGIDMGFALHTHHVTVGQALGEPGCAVPDCGIEWIKTWPPVVLRYWPPTDDPPQLPVTSVANWRGYGSITHDGLFFGQKAHSLRRFVALPRLTDERFQLALAIHPDEKEDVRALAENGWRTVDPQSVAASPSDYRAFIRDSKAELGVAKSGYVVSRCAWFSDRSACYLASGRPVIAQDTGASRFFAGDGKEGVLWFETMDDILWAIERLNDDYSRHCRAARTIAVEHFDSGKVLTRLLDEVNGR